MQQFTIDMTGRQVDFAYPPERIVSVVPSQTELLYDLGLDEEVVGITKFCVHPVAWFRGKTRVGGTKKLNIDKIRTLAPELIIANKEENTREDIETLAKEFPVWISDIRTVDEGMKMIAAVGELVGRKEKAREMVRGILAGFASLQKAREARRVGYFIWYDPWMSVGRDTFIHSVIEAMGWENVFQNKLRYPEVNMADLIAASPEIVLLSSEPFPFKEKHVEEIRAVLPEAEVLLVDGEMFSWYGSRMIKAIPYLSSLVQNHTTDGRKAV